MYVPARLIARLFDGSEHEVRLFSGDPEGALKSLTKTDRRWGGRRRRQRSIRAHRRTSHRGRTRWGKKTTTGRSTNYFGIYSPEAVAP